MREIFDSFPVLRTVDLILRKPIDDDAGDVFSIVSDPEVAKYDWYEPVENMKRLKEVFMDDYEESFAEKWELTWGIEEIESGRLVGIVNLGNFDERNKKCEIGYYMNRNYWNRGYMTQAVKKIVEFAFGNSDVNRIEAFITKGNDASVRMLEKSGFILEGCVRERDFMKGDYVDSIIMSILRKDLSNSK